MNGIPFEDDGSLGGVAAAEDGWGGRVLAISIVDGRLEGEEGFLGSVFGVMVSSDGDVDDATGGDGWREEDRGEFDLKRRAGVSEWEWEGRGELTSLLSSVKRTATPASTLPTVREISILA